jgi:hypothetical protein
MIVPARTTRTGRVVPAFQIDEQFAEEVGKWKWYLAGAGYLKARISGKQTSLARYIWLLHTGDWPKQEIDHINRDKLDNRVANLRDVGRSENLRNRTPLCKLGERKSNKKSGLPQGVYLMRTTLSKPYMAQTCVNGKKKYLGMFATPHEASRAYQEALASIKRNQA